MSNPQFDAQRRLVHLLTPEGMPRAMLLDLFTRVDLQRSALLAPIEPEDVAARGTQVGSARIVTAFYVPHPSAQAGLTQAARHRQWACSPVSQRLDAAHDHPATIAARCTPGDTLVLCHPASGAAYAVAACLSPGIHIINVADGMHAAPIAALCDMVQLWRRLPALHTRVITLVGDLCTNARLRCVIHMLTTLGVPQVSVVHASDVLPPGAATLGAHVYGVSDAAGATVSADVVMSYGEDLVFHGLPAAPADEPHLAYAAVFLAVHDMLMGTA